jgi:glucosamine--fructose-6-phosphate aminotransferase (isomerizing)
MCGIVGLVHRFDPTADMSLDLIVEGQIALADWKVDAPDAAAVLAQIAADLVEPSLALVGWGGFRRLLRDAEACAQVRALVGGLEAAVAAGEGHEASTSEETEALGVALVAVRDLAWRLSQDALPNLEHARALAGDAEATLSDKGWFELWRVNLILNQLERLEVRGRDSGGLGTLVLLERAAWEELEASLGADVRADLQQREGAVAFPDGAILRSVRGDESVALGFAHKVAKEVGELGANVRDLRARLSADLVWRRVVACEGARVQVMAHTRWASNGIISEPNCHPVANDLDASSLDGQVVLGVLNGDVDNFPTLSRDYAIHPTCTTDAKIIPLEVARRAAGSAEFADAFRLAMGTCEGSTAVGVLSSDTPDAVWLAQRGSGQAIYVGFLGSGGYLFASELYGVVELAPRFHKLDGERGEILRLDEEGSLSGWDYEGQRLAPPRTKVAPIATRDIDRAGHPHYFVKEINDAPLSVERTLRGKFVLDGEAAAHFLMGEDVIPGAVREGFANMRIRRVFVIGQGTACVAGLAVADFMARLLQPKGITVQGLPATDLSGFLLDHVGPDTVVIAVSQSGTTTDTNRTVDLARERGAHVIGIVNRRGSDLTDKSQGVLYTSDGRDVEMSVASTKAFYCQVVAGYLLSLALAELAHAIEPTELATHLLRLQDLPRCLTDVLENCRERARQAARLALHRRHWTVVGSGPLTHAAREIRIKLSELCYKSVSADTIEDKKHIDLSSEPMILVCAAGLSGAAAADAVKEVAIFKAHAAIPVVICDRGETRFAEYAAATIEVPSTSPEIAVLLNTIAGHLFSYEAARAIDELTQPLSRARELAQAGLNALARADPIEAAGTVARLEQAIGPLRAEIYGTIEEGVWNAGASSDRVFSLCRALLPGGGAVLSRTPPSPQFRAEQLTRELVLAIDELRRPIDAIKHQAKTVTVGISRDEGATRPPAGPLIESLVEAGISADAVADHDAAALAAIEPAVECALGAVHYVLEGLSPLGAPTDTSHLRVLGKSGVAQGIASRAEAGAPLRGTKRFVVRSPRIWIGHGQRDGRCLLLCPLYGGAQVAGLGLVHVRFKADLDRRTRVRALRAIGRYEDLKCVVTEGDVAWDDAFLDDFASEELLTASAERLAESIGHATQTPAVVQPGGET